MDRFSERCETVASREYHLHDGKTGAALGIRVIPRASKNEISEVQSDGSIKVRLATSTADDKINQALIEFLAQVLEIPANKIEVVAGLNGRDKLVSIIDLNAETVHQRILLNIA